MRRQDLLAGSLALLMLWAPLPGGSMPPAAELVFRLAACALFGLAVWAHGRRPRRAQLVSLAAMAAVAVLGVLQSCSWPAGLAKAFSPEHLRLYTQAAELVGAEAPGWVPLTLDVGATRSSALSWLVAAVLLGVALAIGVERRHRRWLLAALVLATLVELGLGLLGLHRTMPGGLSVLLRPEGRLRGTFANPNHLSLFFEIGLAAVAAWGWYEIAGSGRRAARRALRALLPVGLWLVLGAGVILTGSRAGLAAAAVGGTVQLAVVLLRGRGRASWLAALVFVLVAAALVLALPQLDIQRYARVSYFEENLHGRLLGLRPAVAVWQRFPATGSGLGTFQDAFPLEAPAAFSRTLWNRAHNDPLELLVTGGLVGLLFGALAVGAMLPPIIRATRPDRAAEDRAAGLAAVGVLAAVGLHELLDFGLAIPANQLAALVVLGAAAASGINPSAGRGEG